MSGATAYRILAPAEGPPAEVVTPGGAAPVCLVCEHASAVIPQSLGTLGLADAHRLSHAVWDIGAESLAREMSRTLDAPLVLARVSRLVCDLNRPPDAPDAMPALSGEIPVPGNRSVPEAERSARAAEIYEPFHATVSDVLDGFGAPPAFVTIHSFTPVWEGRPRRTELGLLHDADDRLARAMLAHADPSVVTHLNRPYSARDGVTHTLARHATARGLDNAMIEVRNDLLGTQEGIARMASLLAGMMTAALERRAARA